jgi:hypothetical protein
MKYYKIQNRTQKNFSFLRTFCNFFKILLGVFSKKGQNRGITLSDRRNAEAKFKVLYWDIKSTLA